MGINFTKGWSSPLDNPITRGAGDLVGGAKSAGGAVVDGASSVGGGILDTGRDLVRDVPILGGLLGQESSEERAARAQSEALGRAEDLQREMYGEAKGYLSPYQQVGQDFLLGTPETQYRTVNTPFGPKQIPTGVTRSGGLADMIKSGEFVQDDFNYQGAQPGFQYRGRPMDAFEYQGEGPQGSVGYNTPQPQFDYQGQGQVGQLDYKGSPVDRSISSYMQDDPSLAWQQEQMEKAINRQGAAKGRWGGGATAREMMRETSGLLSQDYANRFNRASMERGADVGAERDRYGRAFDAVGLANRAEESAYGRAGDQYGRDVMRDQTAYDRKLTDVNLGNMADATQYARDQYGYQTGVDREADLYGRYDDQYNRDVDQEQNAYNRQFQQYGIEGQNMQNRLNQYTGMANLGSQSAQAMANAAMGQGSSMSDLAIQQGNVSAASTLAGGNQLGKLMDIGKGGLDLYNAYKGSGK